MNRTIGVVFNRKLLWRAISGHQTHENLGLYEEFAVEYGMKPIFFSISDININKNRVMAYHKTENNKYVKVAFPIPKVIHLRIKIFNKKHIELLGKLKKQYKINIYNQRTSFRKWQIHQYLIKNDDIKRHLPETRLFNKRNLLALVNKHKVCYLKPSFGSLGRGILKIERLSPWKYRVHFMKKNKHVTFICRRKFLWRRLKSFVRKRQYLIQQGIALARINDSPFDMRVSVQKNELGLWQVTGVTTKVAKKGHFLTNIAQGGSSLPIINVLQQLPQLNTERVLNTIKEVVIKATSILDSHIAGLADVGYDIGIDSNGHVYIIELNTVDLRVTFNIAGEIEIWRNTFRTPMGYGKYLYNQLEGNNDEQDHEKTKSFYLLPVIWNPFGFKRNN